MLQVYPEQALEKLEFDKIKLKLIAYCQMTDAKTIVENIRLHTRIDYLEKALTQTHEFKLSLSGGEPFPNNFTHDINKELQLLKIPGAMLQAIDLDKIRKLCVSINGILIWFNKNLELYENLFKIVDGMHYEKEINRIINQVLDDQANIKDSASNALRDIRTDLSQKRQAQRRLFDRVLRALNKEGALADIGESYLNGRRTAAVLAEYKRKIKGIIHGESDSGKTVYIEPEETIAINNEVGELERAEQREVVKVLKETTAQLLVYQEDLVDYYKVCVAFDFIGAKARLAAELNASMPKITAHPGVHIIDGYHPVLLMHNQKQGKPTHPISVSMDRKKRILIISGPNAGGKTVTMKTVGLLQMMVQAGLLIPADPRSEMGIFKQLFIHIGDTQSIENELSTYSAHLKDMKYFAEFSNGKTLFFIDELGSGSDPNLGGAFAEAIVEELVRKNALGIITTHYLNLKVMADKIPSIFNGAMGFDELHLEPLYRLEIGKPGSSYTFAIAERSRLHPRIIERARELTEQDHFKLDKMLHRTERQSVALGKKEKDLDGLVRKYEKLIAEYTILTDKERINQQQATLKLQNEIKKEELDYLKETERKIKQIVADWKKTENKEEVIHAAEKILFKKRQIQQNQSIAKKADNKYLTIGHKPQLEDLVRNKINHQIGTVVAIAAKAAKVKIGNMIFTVNLEEWITVRERTKKGKTHKEVKNTPKKK